MTESLKSSRDKSFNIARMFLSSAEKFKSKKTLFHKKNKTYSAFYSWNDWAKNVQSVALALHSLGIKKGDKIGIFSPNCPEWTFADLGILSLGGIVVPINHSASFEEIKHIVENSEMKMIFVSNPELYQKIKCFSKLFLPQGVVFFSSGAFDDAERQRFSDFLKSGEDMNKKQPDL